MQPDHQLGTLQRRLLGGEVDIEIRVEIVKLTYFKVRQVTHSLQHRLAGTRVLGIGMGVDDEDHGGEGSDRSPYLNLCHELRREAYLRRLRAFWRQSQAECGTTLISQRLALRLRDAAVEHLALLG